MTTSAPSTFITSCHLSRFSKFHLSVGIFRCGQCLALFFLLPGFLAGQEGRYAMADTVVAMRLLEEAKTLIDSTRYDEALGKLDTAEKIYAETVGVEDTSYANVMSKKGYCFNEKGDYDRAIEYYQKTLDIRIKKLGPEHPDVAKSYTGLGVTYGRKSEYNRAYEYFQKALEIQLKKLGSEHSEVALSYNKLGTVYDQKGDYDHAIEYFQKCLEIQLKKLGPEHPDVASTYNNLGAVHKNKGEYDRAIEYNQKALAIRLKKLGPEHPDVARSYNGLGGVYYYKGEYDRAIENYQKAIEIQLKRLGPEHPDVANSYLGLGVACFYKNDFDRAIGYYQKALEIQLKKLGPEHPNVAFSYIGLGAFYGEKSDYDHAIEYLQKALEIQLIKFGPEHPNVANSYSNLGVAYHFKGDYNHALVYIQKALAINLIKFGSEHPDVAASYNNLGVAHRNKGDYGRAIEYHQKALEIQLKKLGSEHPDVAASYNNLGNAHYFISDYDRAIEYHQKALEIQLKKHGSVHLEVANSYSSLGIAYSGKGDYARASEYYQKALEIQLKKFDPEHPDVAGSYGNLGNVYFSKGDYDSAIEYHQKSLEIQLSNLDNEHKEVARSYYNLGISYKYKGEHNLAIEHYQKALDIRLKKLGIEHPDVVSSYYELGELYKSKGNYLQSIVYLKKALYSIVSFRKNLDNPISKSALTKETFKVYEGGISTNLLLHRLTDSLHYLRDAFDYAEQSKAQNLYEAMKNADALHFAGISDSLLQREYDLRIDIAYYDKRRQDLLDEGKSETDTSVLVIDDKRFDLKRTYEALIDTFEIHYPDYYRLKYDFSTVGVRGVQVSLLEEGQTQLEYFVGDSSIFIFVVRKDTFVVVELKKDFPLEVWVDSLRLNMVDHYSTGIADYCRLAYLLYQKLILPVKPLLTEKLIILPDGKLGYLPFETLLTAAPEYPGNFKSHPYLLREYQIGYSYSATLLREMRDKQHQKPPKKLLLAFAPFYDGPTAPAPGRTRENLDPLPHSGEEVKGIRQIAGEGDVFYGKDASKERFVQSAGNYRILHLAQHAQAGDDPRIIFAEIKDSLDNESLYVRDLYNLSLNADMVALSACETGIGRLQRGEGVISLGRAFAYAGAKSIVTSLWTMEDEAAKDLMVLFYRHLKKGLSKDEALRQAKLDYINGSTNVQSHPFFWAGFIAVGDMRPILGN